MKKNKNNVLLFTLLSLFSIIMLSAIASATITINTPTSGEAVNGTYLFNITTDQTAVIVCNFSTTDDGVFANSYNSTDSQTEFVNSSDTSSLTEVLATTLTVACSNDSATQTQTATFDIDNTAPTCSFDINKISTTRQSQSGIEVADLSSDTTTITYLYNLTDSDSNQKQTSTSATPTFLDTDIDTIGEYTINLTVTDEVNKFSSCVKTFLVKGTPTDGTTQSIINSEASGNKWLYVGIPVLFLLIVIIVIIFYLMLEGTKRRH